MIPHAEPDPSRLAAEHEEDRLTRAEASEYLLRFRIQLKPATLARILCTGGDGPPVEHVRGKPWYPRGALRRWAEAQTSSRPVSPAQTTGGRA
ncbi:MAG: hypothetical protein K2X61_05360 [Caulobacteraceae bacterium]|uniref:hypothetical protein n=1 Tax=Brevundimonas bacteroides TaxID=74311 RepID=UPI000497D2BC|nr:hypothetical protein [Brevundimonas bacteroides]MBU1386049.1 hypothetical protein [Alphaproteobacteria bacterium]MBU2349934.1 hypothetical protein [Alphaproteobacteria bacterium]MBU2381564.1 hypothetical protein [Alphaproteobacteria bacterium]MBX9707345.1 hypothetical protein [Caulobacteraceae bacterium]